MLATLAQVLWILHNDCVSSHPHVGANVRVSASRAASCCHVRLVSLHFACALSRVAPAVAEKHALPKTVTPYQRQFRNSWLPGTPAMLQVMCGKQTNAALFSVWPAV